MYKFNVNKTYSVVSPESAEHGEYADQGFIYQDDKSTLKELLKEMIDGGYYYVCSFQGKLRLETADAEIDYQTDENTYYSLHITGSIKNIERLFNIIQKIKTDRRNIRISMNY